MGFCRRYPSGLDHSRAVKAVILCITKKVEWRGTVYSHQMVAGIGAPISAKVETAVENRG